jgi:hypothetical protein
VVLEIRRCGRRRGFALTLLGSHLLDWAERLFGYEMQSWIAFGETRTLSIHFDALAQDLVQLRLVHGSGCVLTPIVDN